MKKIITSILLWSVALPALAGSYHPMPSSRCHLIVGCMEAFTADWLADMAAEAEAEKPVAPVKPPVVLPKTPEPKRCVEKPGGWSELEFYERNTWFFQTWGRLMTVEEREAFRCGWPIG